MHLVEIEKGFRADVNTIPGFCQAVRRRGWTSAGQDRVESMDADINAIAPAYNKTGLRNEDVDGSGTVTPYDRTLASRAKSSKITGLPPGFLQAQGGHPAGDANPLSATALQPLVREAVARWQAAGIDAPQHRALEQVEVRVADLPTRLLLQAAARTCHFPGTGGQRHEPGNLTAPGQSW